MYPAPAIASKYPNVSSNRAVAYQHSSCAARMRRRSSAVTSALVVRFSSSTIIL